MAEDDVIVPSEGNSALDPTKASNGLKPSEPLKPSSTPTEDKKAGRPIGGDSGKQKLEDYWANRRAKAAEDLANGIKPRPKVIFNEGGGGGGGGAGGGGRRSGKFGITNSSARDYGAMKFKSKIFADACSGAYTCIFPLSGYLPQVCGPFRPITVESIGGFPQSLAQEASNVGGPVNSDET